MTAGTTIDRALADRRLLGAGLGELGSWSTWLTVLKGAFGLPLDEAERSTFGRIAGDRAPPGKAVRELWAVVARRSGKSRIAAALAVFEALFRPHKLAKGEVGHVLVLAATQDQARTVFEYASGFIDASATTIAAGQPVHRSPSAPPMAVLGVRVADRASRAA
jgi:hypothetical protein